MERREKTRKKYCKAGLDVVFLYCRKTKTKRRFVELTQEEMERLHEEERDYIVTWRRIYKIEWMANYKVPCFQLMEIPYLRLTKGNYALRGRYFYYTASDVNRL